MKNVYVQQQQASSLLAGAIPSLMGAYISGNPLLALRGASNIYQITSGQSQSPLNRQIQQYLLGPEATEERMFTESEVRGFLMEYNNLLAENPQAMRRVMYQRGYAVSQASRQRDTDLELFPEPRNVYGVNQPRLLPPSKEKEEEEEEEGKIEEVDVSNIPD